MLTRQVAGILSRSQSGGGEAAVTITTPARDLMGDTIDPMGMDTSIYLGGPSAVNFAHNHGRLPVGKTLALDKSPMGIRARFKWREDADSQAVKAAFDDNVLGASVEFTVPEGGAIPNQGGGYHFAKTILTGWALTGNPANAQCVRMFKSLGLWRGEGGAMTKRFDLDEPVLTLVDWPAKGSREEGEQKHYRIIRERRENYAQMLLAFKKDDEERAKAQLEWAKFVSHPLSHGAPVGFTWPMYGGR